MSGRTSHMQVTATSEERELVTRLARMVRAGAIDNAADKLAGELQRVYDNGYSDGYFEGRSDCEDR